MLACGERERKKKGGRQGGRKLTAHRFKAE